MKHSAPWLGYRILISWAQCYESTITTLTKYGAHNAHNSTALKSAAQCLQQRNTSAQTTTQTTKQAATQHSIRTTQQGAVQIPVWERPQGNLALGILWGNRRWPWALIQYPKKIVKNSRASARTCSIWTLCAQLLYCQQNSALASVRCD